MKTAKRQQSKLSVSTSTKEPGVVTVTAFDREGHLRFVKLSRPEAFELARELMNWAFSPGDELCLRRSGRRS
jgi:hypothetical protein